MHDRKDYSDSVFHWIKTDAVGTKSEIEDSAFRVMLQIISDGYLKASGRDTYKNIESVCFTESPEEVMAHQSSKYTCFGFAFDKANIFSLGGRHVIYQKKSEASCLPKFLHWRHVTYDPDDVGRTKPYGVDFTWEREWRLNKDSLDISSATKIIVPHECFAERIVDYVEQQKRDDGISWLFGASGVREPSDFDAYADVVYDKIEVFRNVGAA